MAKLLELIAKGASFTKHIKEVYDSNDWMATLLGYDVEDTKKDEYFAWVENCKRFLATYYKTDAANTEFKRLSGTLTPDNHRKMLAILRSLVEEEEKKPENLVIKVEELEQKMLALCNSSKTKYDDCFSAFKEWYFTALEVIQKFVSDKDADFVYFKNLDCRPGLNNRRYVEQYYSFVSRYKVLLAKCKDNKPLNESNVSIVVPKNAKKPNGELKIFVSYSHADKKFFNMVDTHLKAFTRQQENRSYWTDKEIGVGDKWKEEIDKALHEANVALLLVSANYLASDFIMNDELPPLLKKASEDGTIIATIIVSPCMFEDSPLANIQAGNLPEKTLEEMTKAEQNRTITNLLKELKNREC